MHRNHTPSAIDVQQLTKTYPGGIVAVKGIDFSVAPGEVFGLLGPNGAGKSTTVGMLTTTIAPTSGRACLAGFDVVTQPMAARRASAVVFQEPVVHQGRIVALDSPPALLAALGREILDLRVNGNVATAVSALRAGGIAGEDAFTVGTTVHVPLHTRPGQEAVAAVTALGLPVTAVTSRRPTLDDVYL